MTNGEIMFSRILSAVGGGLLGIWMTVDVFHRLEIVFGRIPGRVSAEQKSHRFPQLVFKVQKKQKTKHLKGRILLVWSTE